MGQTPGISDNFWGGCDAEYQNGIMRDHRSIYLYGSSKSFSWKGGGAYIIKTDTAGNTIWAKMIETQKAGGTTDYRAVLMDDDHFMLMGPINVSPNYGIMKLDTGGNVVKSIGMPQQLMISKTNDNGLFVAGSSIYRLDGNLNVIYRQSYYSSFGSDLTTVNVTAMKSTSDGGYIAWGIAKQNVDSKPCLIRADKNGGTVWIKTYNQQVKTSGYQILEPVPDQYLVSGISAQNRAFLLSVDGSGGILWSKYYDRNGPIYQQDIALTADGNGIIMGGQSDIQDTSGWTNYYSAYRLDATGTVMWANRYENEITTFGELSVSSESILMGGSSPDNPTTDTAWSNTDFNLIRVELNGSSAVPYKPISISGLNFITDTIVDSLVSTFQFFSVTPVQMTSTDVAISFDSTDCSTVGIPEEKTSDHPVLFPNPMGASSRLFFPGNDPVVNAWRIFSMNGQLLREMSVTDPNNIIIEREDMPAGVYVVEVKGDGGFVGRVKLVIK
ncbi:MAG: T9SS type A sorting domain-containing protein [Flavobacteriales bacterium]|nr:T9SS type A sorting domain-containing protein [Flavobacteriales bacterium]